MLRKISIAVVLLHAAFLECVPFTSFSFHEYQVQMPMSWHRVDQRELIRAHRSVGQDIFFDREFNGKSFARAWYLPSEKEAATCIIYRMKTDKERSLKQQFKAIIEDLQQMNKDPLGEDIHILRKGSETLQGVKAKWFSADTQTQGTNMRRLEYILLKKGRLYNIRFISEKKQFQKLKKSFRKIAKSLVIR
jgi:hypothetical protein